jgi:DNA modification methylase
MSDNSKIEKTVQIVEGSCLQKLKDIPDGVVQCVVTSPPYFQCRQYGDHTSEIGREQLPGDFINALCNVLDEIWRVLKSDGVVWFNIGDSFAKKKYKECAIHPVIKKGEAMLLPFMFATEARKRGWYVQQDIIWAKTNPIPSSTPKRCTPSHEHIWMLTKSDTYTFDPIPITTPCKTPQLQNKSQLPMPPIGGVKRAGGVNVTYSGNRPVGNGRARKRDVWFETTSRCSESHFAPFPERIVEPCILSTTKRGDVVLDPFSGTGTVARVCMRLERSVICIELYRKYVDMIKNCLKIS